MGLQHRIRAIAPTPTLPVSKTALEPTPKVTGKKRGPKPTGDAKILISLRLDPAVVAKFKATGKGWQSRMNKALERAIPSD